MDSNCVRTSRDGFLDGVHMHLHVDLDDTNCALDDMVKECLGWVGMVGWWDGPQRLFQIEALMCWMHTANLMKNLGNQNMMSLLT